MNGVDYASYFLEPNDSAHRRYEAVRAVHVEGQSMKDVAENLGVSYGTVRNWVSEFRQQVDRGETPPFSFQQNEDDQ